MRALKSEKAKALLTDKNAVAKLRQWLITREETVIEFEFRESISVTPKFVPKADHQSYISRKDPS